MKKYRVISMHTLSSPLNPKRMTWLRACQTHQSPPYIGGDFIGQLPLTNCIPEDKGVHGHQSSELPLNRRAVATQELPYSPYPDRVCMPLYALETKRSITCSHLNVLCKLCGWHHASQPPAQMCRSSLSTSTHLVHACVREQTEIPEDLACTRLHQRRSTASTTGKVMLSTQGGASTAQRPNPAHFAPPPPITQYLLSLGVLSLFLLPLGLAQKSESQCSAPFGDCRASRCCRFSSEFSCYRLPGLYYAQCRTESESPCGDADQPWRCPGWDTCAPAYAECTMSRCCADPAFGCMLNRTATVATPHGGWHAFCQPHTEVAGDQQELHALRLGDVARVGFELMRPYPYSVSRTYSLSLSLSCLPYDSSSYGFG